MVMPVCLSPQPEVLGGWGAPPGLPSRGSPGTPPQPRCGACGHRRAPEAASALPPNDGLGPGSLCCMARWRKSTPSPLSGPGLTGLQHSWARMLLDITGKPLADRSGEVHLRMESRGSPCVQVLAGQGASSGSTPCHIVFAQLPLDHVQVPELGNVGGPLHHPKHLSLLPESQFCRCLCRQGALVVTLSVLPSLGGSS